MEDGEDRIRIATARALSSFAKSHQKRNKDNFDPFDISKIENVTKELLIHMDDLNKDVQNAACNAIAEFLRLSSENPQIVGKVKEQVEQARRKHHDPQFCDFILQVASSLQST